MPRTTTAITTELLAEILPHVNTCYHVDEHDHWIWDEQVDKVGAPVYGRKAMRARRIMWAAQHGDLPGNRLMARCGNSLCVNPDHCSPNDGRYDHLWHEDEHGHWMWEGHTDNRGTPIYGSESSRVRRLTWEARHGELPQDSHVYGDCGQALCVNPDHCVLNDPHSTLSASWVQRYATGIERLLANVCIEDECWIQPNVCIRAYGCKTSKRTAYTFYKGAIPEGERLKSTCNHYRCINPDHLELSSWKDNPALADLDEKPKNWHLYKQKPRVDLPSREQVEADMEFLQSPRERLRRKFREQRANA